MTTVADDEDDDEGAEHRGLALFRTAEAPGPFALERLRRRGVEVEPLPQEPGRWAVVLTHPAWGEAVVASDPDVRPPAGTVLAIDPALTPSERRAVTEARSALALLLVARDGGVLRERKRLLRWMREVLGPSGVAAYDSSGHRTWTPAALDEELSHDAPLDASHVFMVHAVAGERARRPRWVHTHGLAEAGSFDLDVVRPGAAFLQHGPEILRLLAMRLLCDPECPADARVRVASTDTWADLVPAVEFMRRAAAADRRVRDDPDGAHAERRVVLCEPCDDDDAPPRPARVLGADAGARLVVHVSKAASQLIAERARATLPVLRGVLDEFRELRPRTSVQFTVGPTPERSETLWFDVEALHGEEVEAKLSSTPVGDVGVLPGETLRRPLAEIGAWRVDTAYGPVSPWIGAPRRLREVRAACDELQAEWERDGRPPPEPWCRRRIAAGALRW